jgi:XRE family transcriptional regulator, aerobic/anaerobic benzoate catabolism transcriptional regulator
MPEQEQQQLVALGRAVRQLRERQGLTQAQLAEAAGMSQQRLHALEAGEVDPHFDTLLALADGLGIRPATLFSRADDECEQG